MDKMTIGQILDKYEYECGKRDECGGCPYDRNGDTSRWDCFENCLVDNGVAKDIIQLLQPVVEKISKESVPLCEDCSVLRPEMCMVCKAKEVVEPSTEVDAPKYINVADLRREWYKLYKGTLLEKCMDKVLSNVEHRRY